MTAILNHSSLFFISINNIPNKKENVNSFM
jgi:hypothetical protein